MKEHWTYAGTYSDVPEDDDFIAWPVTDEEAEQIATGALAAIDALKRAEARCRTRYISPDPGTGLMCHRAKDHTGAHYDALDWLWWSVDPPPSDLVQDE